MLRELDLLLEPDVAVGHAGPPLEIEDVVDAVHEHADAFAAVGDLDRDRRELHSTRLLKVGELTDLHSIHQHLPADAGGAERGGFPVVLIETDVVRLRLDAERGQRFEVEVLHVGRRRLQDDLELVVPIDAERVLAVPSVDRPARGGAVGHAPRLRPQDAEEGVRVHRPGAHLDVVRLLQQRPFRGPVLLQSQDQLLKIERHIVTRSRSSRLSAPGAARAESRSS